MASTRVLRFVAVKGTFLAYRRPLVRRARALRRDPTPAERRMWFEFLRGLSEKFTRQKPLGDYIADFYCAGHRLVIELDGDTHFTADGQRRDLERTAALGSAGIRVLRFTNAEVMESFEGVCERVKSALRKT